MIPHVQRALERLNFAIVFAEGVMDGEEGGQGCVERRHLGADLGFCYGVVWQQHESLFGGRVLRKVHEHVALSYHISFRRFQHRKLPLVEVQVPLGPIFAHLNILKL